MLQLVLCLLAALGMAFAQDAFPDDAYPGTPKSPEPAHILVVYASGEFHPVKQLADAIGEGASSAGAKVQVLDVMSANYKRHVFEWADGVVLGSAVFNGAPSSRLLDFVNSFDIMDDLSQKVGGAFATGGSAAAGLENVLNTLERALSTFGVVTVGGSSWRNRQGTAGITTGGMCPTCTELIDAHHTLGLARDQGKRVAFLASKLKGKRPGAVDAPLPGISRVLDSVAVSLGNARWTPETHLKTTCEAYCRGWTAAVGCGTCAPEAFSFPGADHMCIHPGPLGTGLLCRMDQLTGKVTGKSCCGVGGPCELPEPSPSDANDTSSLWPGGCCHGGNCGNCPGGSPVSDVFPLLNDTRTFPSNRRYFDYKTNMCRTGVDPATFQFRV